MSSSGRPQRRRRRALLVGLVAASATMAVAALLPQAASADTTPPVGAAGTDTSLPLTDTAVTVSGQAGGPGANLKITVNQTQNLNNQAISVSWTGGAPSTITSSEIDENFLQIFQCWGDDPGGPPPEQCEFGANQILGSVPRRTPGPSDTRVISELGWAAYDKDKSQGYADPGSGLAWKPFRAVDGTTVNVQVGIAEQGQGLGSWQNPSFDLNTTNEEDYGFTYPDGTGSVLFHVDTSPYAPGLGCGAQSEVHPDGSTTVPKCWLVVVPRGTALQENAPAGVPGSGNPVLTSPLSPEAWPNRIAIALQFNLVDSACAIGAHQRGIVGGEMAASAVGNWEPRLCSIPGLPPYAYTYGSENVARQAVVSGEQGAPGMVAVSRPLDPATVDPSTPVVYAPLTLSGLVIGFNIERQVRTLPRPPDTETLLGGQRVAHINLTPRLVAKLLTESYKGQFLDGVVPPGYDWLQNNPVDMPDDPDFQQYNPEFQYLSSSEKRNTSGLVVEQSTSDATSALWSWVLADPEARAWLGGAPDNATEPSLSGMRVNPYFSTDPFLDPQGAFGNPIPDTFPKSDPYCAPRNGTFNNQPVAPRCMTDIMPYALTLQAAARETRVANDGAKVGFIQGLDWFSTPQLAGNRGILSVTDSASAVSYGLQTASLSRAGDDTAGRTFAAPDQAGLLAGEQSMVPSPVPGVLQPNPTTAHSGAYPLTLLTYAAAIPGALDATAHTDYANFINYAVTKGQTPGFHYGDLPAGYAPLPADLVSQAQTAAKTIAAKPAPATTTTTSTPPTTRQAGAVTSQTAAAAVATTTTSGPAKIVPAPTTTAAPTTTSAPPKVALPRSQAKLASSRTPAAGVGAIRYVLPITLIIGILAAIGVRLLDKRRQGAHPASRPPNPV